MLTTDEVIWGYRYVLGRDPENGTVIERQIRTHADWGKFRQALMRSAEFARARIERTSDSRWVIAPILAGERLIWLDLADSYVSRGCLYDSYEPVETKLVRKYLKADDVFLDIGANIGWFTLLASTIVGPNGRIYSFEPRRPTADFLRKSIALNSVQSLVMLHEVALDREASEKLLGWAEGTVNPGSSMVITATDTSGLKTIPIKAIALDSLGIPKVDFVKIDVEGAEMRVFEGARQTLERNLPIVLSEVHPAQLKRVSQASPDDYFGWFLSRGYEAFIADAVRCDEQIRAFPPDWHRELLNVIFLPAGLSP